MSAHGRSLVRVDAVFQDKLLGPVFCGMSTVLMLNVRFSDAAEPASGNWTVRIDESRNCTIGIASRFMIGPAGGDAILCSVCTARKGSKGRIMMRSPCAGGAATSNR